MPQIPHSISTRLIAAEGLRLKPYRCPAGKLTIGVGRNLEDTGITKDEAMVLLEGDIKRVVHDLTGAFPFFNDLDFERRYVLIDMCFNLGLSGLMGFKKMLAALKAQDYIEASSQMLDSAWAKQVPARAERLSFVMRCGVWLWE